MPGKKLTTPAEPLDTELTPEKVRRTMRRTTILLDRMLAKMNDRIELASLGDLTKAAGVMLNGLEKLQKHLDILEGTNSHTMASMARQLEGFAAAQQELERRTRAVDVTPQEQKNADEGSDLRKGAGRDQPNPAEPGATKANGTRQPVPPQGGEGSEPVPNEDGWEKEW